MHSVFWLAILLNMGFAQCHTKGKYSELKHILKGDLKAVPLSVLENDLLKMWEIFQYRRQVHQKISLPYGEKKASEEVIVGYDPQNRNEVFICGVEYYLNAPSDHFYHYGSLLSYNVETNQFFTTMPSNPKNKKLEKDLSVIIPNTASDDQINTHLNSVESYLKVIEFIRKLEYDNMISKENYKGIRNPKERIDLIGLQWVSIDSRLQKLKATILLDVWCDDGVFYSKTGTSKRMSRVKRFEDKTSHLDVPNTEEEVVEITPRELHTDMKLVNSVRPCTPGTNPKVAYSVVVYGKNREIIVWCGSSLSFEMKFSFQSVTNAYKYFKWVEDVVEGSVKDRFSYRADYRERFLDEDDDNSLIILVGSRPVSKEVEMSLTTVGLSLNKNFQKKLGSMADLFNIFCKKGASKETGHILNFEFKKTLIPVQFHCGRSEIPIGNKEVFIDGEVDHGWVQFNRSNRKFVFSSDSEEGRLLFNSMMAMVGMKQGEKADKDREIFGIREIETNINAMRSVFLDSYGTVGKGVQGKTDEGHDGESFVLGLEINNRIMLLADSHTDKPSLLMKWFMPRPKVHFWANLDCGENEKYSEFKFDGAKYYAGEKDTPLNTECCLLHGAVDKKHLKRRRLLGAFFKKDQFEELLEMAATYFRDVCKKAKEDHVFAALIRNLKYYAPMEALYDCATDLYLLVGLRGLVGLRSKSVLDEVLFYSPRGNEWITKSGDFVVSHIGWGKDIKEERWITSNARAYDLEYRGWQVIMEPATAL